MGGGCDVFIYRKMGESLYIWEIKKERLSGGYE